MTSKSELRKVVRKSLSVLSSQQIEADSLAVCQKIIALLICMEPKRVLLYSPRRIPAEINIASIEIWLDVQNIEYDRVSSKKNAALPPGKPYDAIIVPVMGFDDECFRLGNGGGWYDRLLAAQPNTTTIGAAFDEGKVVDLPHEPHDIMLDYVMTPSRNYKIMSL